LARLRKQLHVAKSLECDQPVLLDGLTVSDSYYDPYHPSGFSAAVLLDESSLIMRNCRMVNGHFAGILARDSDTVTLTDCVLSGSRGLESYETTSVTATDCQFIDRAVVHVNSGDLTLENCHFVEAGASFYGSSLNLSRAKVNHCIFERARSNALNLVSGEFRLTNNAFIGNSSQLRMVVGAATVDNCRFSGSMQNTVVGGFGSALFRNCAFIHNSRRQAAIRWGSGNLYVFNSTIVGNGLSENNHYGGGLDLDGASAQVLNSIIWGNGGAPRRSREDNQIHVDEDSTLEIDYSIVEGWTGIYGGDGNSGLDPMLVDPDGPDDMPGTEDDNVRLSPNSPAVDDGLSSSPYLRSPELDGHARILCGDVDIGAYEFGIGDFNCDRTVNLSDFTHWPGCITGPDPPQSPLGKGGRKDHVSGETPQGCEAFDFNADADIDLADFAAFDAEFMK